MFLKSTRRGPMGCCAALLLVACGGGSSGEDPPSAGPAPPLGDVGPPSPVIVDESGVPASSESRRFAITLGLRADLLLLDADPLEDIANVNRRVGVMAGGRWFAQSTLMAMAGNGAGP